MYLCNYNNVLVRKYVSLSIPLVKIVGPLGRVSGFHTVGTSCLVKNVDNTSCKNLLYFPRYENETSIIFLYFPRYENEISKRFYTFLGMRTRQV